MKSDSRSICKKCSLVKALKLCAIIVALVFLCSCGANEDLVIPSFTEVKMPKTEYTGELVDLINDNQPFFVPRDYSESVFEYYSELDDLGRCGYACANLCKELRPISAREAIAQIKPSGWNLSKYDFIEDGSKYLFNRCHLIAYELSGENANENNLITGTRYFNVKGMLPYEEKIIKYLDANDNHVLYRVTPDFRGDDLVASGVLMEAYSIEDQGAGICFNVYVHNVQPGVVIDYRTGDSRLDDTVDAKGDEKLAELLPLAPVIGASVIDSEKDTDVPVNPQETIGSKVEERSVGDSTTYILNSNPGRMRFHYPDCRSVKDIADKNYSETTKTRDEIIALGVYTLRKLQTIGDMK